ncbi:MAG: class flavin-dependent oxidoreductase [Gammaproteobacteria bacterium]|nr:class flavin-dependent oxidoreductase [Gammaproteobacteria bacterium]
MTESGSLKTWVGVGGTPQSVVRAARYGLPMMLAIIGGSSQRFAPYIDLYRRSLDQAGKPAQPIGVHSPGYVADTDEQAREELWPDFKRSRDRIGAERGWGPMRRADFDQEADHGSLYVGAPETVARKIATTAKGLDISRFDMKYSAGCLSHEKLMHSIELYAAGLFLSCATWSPDIPERMCASQGGDSRHAGILLLDCGATEMIRQKRCDERPPPSM